MKAQRISLLAVAALATTTLALPAASQARGDGETVESKIAMYHYGNSVTKRHVEGNLYAGEIGRKVYEPVFACTRHRKVKLYTRKSGEDKRLAGTTYTDRDRDHSTDWGGLALTKA